MKIPANAHTDGVWAYEATRRRRIGENGINFVKYQWGNNKIK